MSMSEIEMEWVVIIAVMIIGPGFLLLSFMEFRRVRKLLKFGIRTTGKVGKIEAHQEWGSEGVKRYCYYPVFSFTDEAGQNHVVKAQNGCPRSVYSIDQGVSIIYDPDKPEGARIESFFHLWPVFIFTLILGVAFTWSGFTMISRIAK